MMSRIKRAYQHLVSSARSPLGCFLAITHALVLTTAILAKPVLPPVFPCERGHNADEVCFDVRTLDAAVIANRAFHWEYERPTIKVLMLTDIPALWFGAFSVAISLLVVNLMV